MSIPSSAAGQALGARYMARPVPDGNPPPDGSSAACRMQDKLPPVRTVAMLDEVKTLPWAERETAVDHRNGKGCAGQHGADVGRHVVRPL